jgi:hypothetical protein
MKNVKEEQPKIRFVIWTDPSGKYRIVRKDISPGSQYHSFAYEVLYMNHMDEKIWVPTELMSSRPEVERELLYRYVEYKEKENS